MEVVTIFAGILDLEGRLEMLKEQETFLNVNQETNAFLRWIFLTVKCFIAGFGIIHLLNKHTTMIFAVGTFINGIIHVKSWLVPVFSAMFGAATFMMLNYMNIKEFMTRLCWIAFTLQKECEFYMDIYLVLCFIALISKMYNEEYSKVIAFLLIMPILNWVIDNEELLNDRNVLFIYVSYMCLFYVLRPSMQDTWEYAFSKRTFYNYVNWIMFLLLLLK